MIFKRKKETGEAAAATTAAETAPATITAASDAPNAKAAPQDRATKGPFDVTEVPAIRPYIDMGSIKVAPREGLKVRLDVDETSKRIIAISLDYEGSTLQVQAFSAPKSTGLWHEAREQIMASLKEQGAQVTEQESVFGTEVLMQSPPNAEQVAAVRFFGVDGPRWMLRGVLVGAGAVDPARASGIESVFRELVVVRGDAPLPPSELLPLQMPANVGQAPTA
ncbi:DUF3710 domain-containing protein [Leucobacter sp. OH2974_COT-288]|nr:DUF3710 domain-containing protein [Leucobacter sp. OH2974_COT-288]